MPAKTAEPTRVGGVGERTTSTMPGGQGQRERSPACSQPRSLGLTSSVTSRDRARCSVLVPRRVACTDVHAVSYAQPTALGSRLAAVTSAPEYGLGAGTVGAWRTGSERLRRVLYPAYEARVVRRLPADRLPKHVGVMLDGNRRWARPSARDTAHGHRAGAANIEPLLGWCDELGVEVVTLWLLSTDNLNRPRARARAAARHHRGRGRRRSPTQQRWRLHPVGALDLLPADDAERLKEAAEATRDVDGMLVNVAVGYGGRREIADAVRSLLQEHAAQGTTIEELAEVLDVEHIAEHLYTKGQPDPDLVIRTSRRAAARRLPAVAERAQRVLLLRGLLARLPPRRLPARPPRLRRARAPLRLLTGAVRPSQASPGVRACRAGRRPRRTFACQRRVGKLAVREARS